MKLLRAIAKAVSAFYSGLSIGSAIFATVFLIVFVSFCGQLLLSSWYAASNHSSSGEDTQQGTTSPNRSPSSNYYEFRCATSTLNAPTMSLDNGVTWLADDGRCAAREQKKRDEEAEDSSYWPTTVRVGTDMDSFWLNNEERTCQSFPDVKGRVSVVACNDSGNHRGHNIPVRFWGGVDRNTVSDWKCPRGRQLRLQSNQLNDHHLVFPLTAKLT